jgi:hypothetical protein
MSSWVKTQANIRKFGGAQSYTVHHCLNHGGSPSYPAWFFEIQRAHAAVCPSAAAANSRLEFHQIHREPTHGPSLQIRPRAEEFPAPLSKTISPRRSTQRHVKCGLASPPPSLSSKSDTCRLTAGWATRRCVAAFVKFNASPTATKDRRWRNSIVEFHQVRAASHRKFPERRLWHRSATEMCRSSAFFPKVSFI